jgi:hypothetical protein
MGRVSDIVRFEIAPEQCRDFQLRVHVNDIEITSAGAGIGRDPHHLLLPDNLLVATEEPRDVVIATCECGEYGCGRTDVTIVREADTVRWKWLYEKPMKDDVVFDAQAYDREVERIGRDFSWETPDRTAARLVFAGLTGRKVAWASADREHPERFQVCVENAHGREVVEHFHWEGRSPQELARAVVEKIGREDRGAEPFA